MSNSVLSSAKLGVRLMMHCQHSYIFLKVNKILSIRLSCFVGGASSWEIKYMVLDPQANESDWELESQKESRKQSNWSMLAIQKEGVS